MYMLIIAIPSEAFSIKAVSDDENTEAIALNIVMIEGETCRVIMQEYVDDNSALSNITPPYREELTSHLQKETFIFDSEDALFCQGVASHDACFAHR